MSVVVELTVPAESFTLSRALTAMPDVTVEAERVASHSPEWALPFLWASGSELDAFYDAMKDDPTIDTVGVIEEAGEEVLYKVEWCDEILDLITEMIDQHAIILEATAQAHDWRLRIRFAKHEQVSSFRDHFAEQGRQFEVTSLHQPTTPRQREFGLTPEQRDALVTALRTGYFEVPRDSSIEELGDALGISSNAVSQRLRRGSTNLIRNSLVIDTDESADAEDR